MKIILKENQIVDIWNYYSLIEKIKKEVKKVKKNGRKRK